jgi:hypothetical protein
MAGISPLVCREFVETEGFVQSREVLLRDTGLTMQQVDDRVEALEWALARGDIDEEGALRPVPGLNIWAAVLPRGIPPLRLYLKPCGSVEHKCEWLWIEERL